MENLMSVQVRQSHLRKGASFLSPVLGLLSYGDRVSVIDDTSSGWIKVKSGSMTGFVHDSALTTKEVVLNPGAKDVEKAASSEEYALAGKGFNEEVEGKFREGNPHLNFAAVDRMEKRQVSLKQMQAFMVQGRIVPKGGTA
ncbi:MAG: SH3 domain-containing protein [Desulfobacterales bacterium]|nr:SH3 domain-containing protein [Desulfobacterales bacterium]